MIGLTPAEEDIRDRNGAGQPPKPPTERERYISGLRKLADALEAHDCIPEPWHGFGTELMIMFLDDGAREAMAAAARALPCDWRKNGRDEYFDLNGELDGLKLMLTAYRNDVCERVVVGTEQRPVEKVITPAVTETVMEPAEIIEWRCGSLLAPRPAVSDEAPKAVA